MLRRKGREFDAELTGSEEPPIGSGGSGGSKEGLNIGDSSDGEAGGVSSATFAGAEDARVDGG